MESMFQPNQPLTLESLRTLESGKADKSAVESALNAVNESLEKKADKTAVNDALEKKADKTTVNDALALKADKTAVSEALEKKADKTLLESNVSSLNGVIAQKASTSDFNKLKTDVESISGTLAQKADSSAVNTSLNSKLSTSGGTISGTISFPNGGTLLEATTALNDYCRVYAGDTGENKGYLELATADDGTEPIVCRQYSGHFTNTMREVILLGEDGSSNFNKLYENGQRVLTGSAFSYSNGVLRITI